MSSVGGLPKFEFSFQDPGLESRLNLLCSNLSTITRDFSQPLLIQVDNFCTQLKFTANGSSVLPSDIDFLLKELDLLHQRILREIDFSRREQIVQIKEGLRELIQGLKSNKEVSSSVRELHSIADEYIIRRLEKFLGKYIPALSSGEGSIKDRAVFVGRRLDSLVTSWSLPLHTGFCQFGEFPNRDFFKTLWQNFSNLCYAIELDEIPLARALIKASEPLLSLAYIDNDPVCHRRVHVYLQEQLDDINLELGEAVPDHNNVEDLTDNEAIAIFVMTTMLRAVDHRSFDDIEKPKTTDPISHGADRLKQVLIADHFKDFLDSNQSADSKVQELSQLSSRLISILKRIIAYNQAINSGRLQDLSKSKGLIAAESEEIMDYVQSNQWFSNSFKSVAGELLIDLMTWKQSIVHKAKTEEELKKYLINEFNQSFKEADEELEDFDDKFPAIVKTLDYSRNEILEWDNKYPGSDLSQLKGFFGRFWQGLSLFADWQYSQEQAFVYATLICLDDVFARATQLQDNSLCTNVFNFRKAVRSSLADELRTFTTDELPGIEKNTLHLLSNLHFAKMINFEDLPHQQEMMLDSFQKGLEANQYEDPNSSNEEIKKIIGELEDRITSPGMSPAVADWVDPIKTIGEATTLSPAFKQASTPIIQKILAA